MSKDLLPKGRLWLTASEAQALSKGAGSELLMSRLIAAAQTHAHVGISQYRVGAVGRLMPGGDLVLGVNLEFPGLALNQSVHAEQFVVSLTHSLLTTKQLAAPADTTIAAIAVSAAPCGHCRQFLNELAGKAQLEFLLPGNQRPRLTELLPQAFGPEDLGHQGGLLTPQLHDLQIGSASGDPVVAAALRAAQHSYAPYGHCPAGVALTLHNSEVVYTGSYLENVAFNPSLSPLQAALVHVVGRGQSLTAIKRAVLVEHDDFAQGPSQFAATATLLKTIAPHVPLERVACYLLP